MLLGLDLGAVSGFALWTPVHVRCGTFRAVGETEAERFASFARLLTGVIRDETIEAAAIEAPLPPSMTETVVDKSGDFFGAKRARPITNMQVQTALYGYRAIAMAVLATRGIPVREVAVQTWRSSFFGKGTTPPKGLTSPQRRAWWKKQAVTYVRALKINVPNADAAESVGVATWLAANRAHHREEDALRARAA